MWRWNQALLLPLVRKLKSLGLVECERAPGDDRSELISLSAAGCALSKRARALRDGVACATQCSTAQRQTLSRSLRWLRRALLSSHH